MAIQFPWYIGNYGFLGQAATVFPAQGQASSSSILGLGLGLPDTR